MVNKAITKGLVIFSVFTVLAIVVLLVLTVNAETLKTRRSIDYQFIALSVILVCLSLCFDVL